MMHARRGCARKRGVRGACWLIQPKNYALPSAAAAPAAVCVSLAIASASTGNKPRKTFSASKRLRLAMQTLTYASPSVIA